MSFRFKGEPIVEKKKKKKEKKRIKENEKESLGEEESSIWTICKDISFLKGPILIMDLMHSALLNHVAGTDKVSFRPPPPRFAADTSTYISTSDAGGGASGGGDQVQQTGDGALEKQKEAEMPFITSLETAEPWAGSQVWIAHPHVGGKFTIKSCFDKLLSCDKIGVVSCDLEAAGPCETWTISPHHSPTGTLLGYTFKTFYSTYLTVDPVSKILRGDAESIGPSEIFGLKMQQRALDSQVKLIKNKVVSAEAETEALTRFWSFGGKKISMITGNTKELTKAKKEGNLNEVLLERRSKVKKDKFC